MPIREYRCSQCGRVTERVEGIGGSIYNNPICPHTQDIVMELVQFSKPGNPQFKGDGWASDGYSKKETT